MTDGWFLPLLLGISLPQVDARWLELRVLEESSADFVLTSKIEIDDVSSL